MEQQTQELSRKLYKVNVPIIATYSEEELEVYGVGLDLRDGETVKESYESMTRVMINIDKMIDIYLQGYPITILDQNESAEIYKELERYLTGVNHTQDYSPNRMRVKDERLEEVDKFAAEIFGFNRNTIVKSNVSTAGGFDLGAHLMNGHRPLHSVRHDNEPVRKMGLLGAYENNDEYEEPKPSVDRTETFINHRMPEIDVSKIKRRSLYRERSSLDDYK